MKVGHLLCHYDETINEYDDDDDDNEQMRLLLMIMMVRMMIDTMKHDVDDTFHWQQS